MGSDCGPDRTDRKLLRVILPEHLAVLDVFLEKGIVDSCITKPEGQGKIDAAGILNLFYQEIVSVLEPRAFPRTATTPSSTVTTGLMESMPPIMATDLEILPPFFRYSSVSRRAIT